MEALFAGCTRLRDRLLLEAGLRIGEALGPRHEDVCTPDGVVEIRQRVNANRARAKTWSARSRSGPRGCGCTPAVTDLFARLARRTGVTANPHMFRHTYATRLLRSGVKAEVVQKLLGHASVTTTIDTYAPLTVEDVRRELRRAGCLEPEDS